MSQKSNACIWYQRKSTSVRQSPGGLSQLYPSQQEFFDIKTSATRAKKNIFVICASSLHPIPPFCDVLKGEVLHWLPTRFDAVSITCFHLNSPVTDTILIALVCVVQKPSSVPLTHTGACKRLAEGTILPVFPVLDLVLAKKMASWISSRKQIRTKRSSKKPQKAAVVTDKSWYLHYCGDPILTTEEYRGSPTSLGSRCWHNVVCSMQSY